MRKNGQTYIWCLGHVSKKDPNKVGMWVTHNLANCKGRECRGLPAWEGTPKDHVEVQEATKEEEVEEALHSVIMDSDDKE